jgi:hypothetical protein
MTMNSGWKNDATFQLSNYISGAYGNDEEFYLVLSKAKEFREISKLNDWLKIWAENLIWKPMPIETPIDSLRRDLISFVLDIIDWEELSEDYINLASEDSGQ